MLLSTGERISCALMAMALHDLGHQAVSFTGSQAGIFTDSAHTKARIVEIRADRIRAALDDGQHRAGRRLSGHVDQRQERHDARARRQRHDRRRPGGGDRRGRVRDLHRRDRGVHRRPADRARGGQAAAHQPRGNAGDGRHGLQGPGATISRVRTQLRRPSARALVVCTRRGDLDHQGDTRHGARDRVRHRAQERRGQDHDHRGPRPTRCRGVDLHGAGRRVDQRRHHHPEHGHRRTCRPLVYGAAGRAESRPGDPRRDQGVRSSTPR